MLLTEDSEDELSCESSNEKACKYIPITRESEKLTFTTMSSCYEVTWHLSTAPDVATFGTHSTFHFQLYPLPGYLLKVVWLLACLSLSPFANFSSHFLPSDFLLVFYCKSHCLALSFHLCFSFIISLHFPHLHSSDPILYMHTSKHDLSLAFLFIFYPMSHHPGRKPMPSSNASSLFLSSTILILNFLSYIYLWSLSSSSLSTSDPSFPNFVVLWSLRSPELWGMSLCVSCLCRSLHVWWPWGRDDTALLEWKGTESGRSSTNALLNPLQYTMSSS